MPLIHKDSASFISSCHTLARWEVRTIEQTNDLNLNTAIFIGIDTHPTEHTALAINRFEEEKGRLRFENTKEGIAEFLHWLPTLETHTDQVVIGVEGSGGDGHALVSYLLPLYEHVYEVNPLYTKQRRTLGTRGRKSDPIDAKLVAEVLTRKMALYQHSCHEVQSSCNALSVKELQQRSAIGLLSQQRMKSISAT